MARYQNSLQTPNPAHLYASSINKYMQSEGFSLVDYKGGKVWKKGVGILTAPQFFSIRYYENSIVLEAFIRYPLLPGVYVGEMGLDGFFGAVPKNLLRGRVQAVEKYIASLWQSAAAPTPPNPPDFNAH